MARVGLSVRIDVTKIDKERLYKGKKGTYLDLVTFVDLDNKDQYDNNGFISQSTTKEERESGVQTPILGNVRIIGSPAVESQSSDSLEELEEDVPF